MGGGADDRRAERGDPRGRDYSGTAGRRDGWYPRNNPWVAATVDSLVDNVVGAGIKAQYSHSDRAVRERLEAL